MNRDGAFADYLTLPIANLHVVPDNVPDDVAVFTEPVAAAFQILAQLHIDSATASSSSATASSTGVSAGAGDDRAR